MKLVLIARVNCSIQGRFKEIYTEKGYLMDAIGLIDLIILQ